ncbi:MAG: DUF3108 domain-containing protein, partial [Sphingobacteriaceae bacterium]
MKKYFLLISFFLITAYNQSFAQAILDNVDKPVFGVGEHLSYKLKYGIFTAAEAELRVEESKTKFDGNPAYHIIADGNTAGSFDVFYKVRNRYESYVDKTTLLPYYYTENRREGKYRHTDKVTFDNKNGHIKADKGEYDFKGKPFESLYSLYVRFHDEAEKNKELDAKGSATFRKLEQGDAQITQIWREFVDI